eukprot:m.274343 g.274343  ORF g.274343 m.274343 type:complete len:54 (-) comp69052_c1_seq1:118-279(-)
MIENNLSSQIREGKQALTCVVSNLIFFFGGRFVFLSETFLYFLMHMNAKTKAG